MLDLKPMEDVTRSPKTGVSVASQKRLMLPFFEKSIGFLPKFNSKWVGLCSFTNYSELKMVCRVTSLISARYFSRSFSRIVSLVTFLKDPGIF